MKGMVGYIFIIAAVAIIIAVAFSGLFGFPLGIVTDPEGCIFAEPHFGTITCDDGGISQIYENEGFVVVTNPTNSNFLQTSYTCTGVKCELANMPEVGCPGGLFPQDPAYAIAKDDVPLCGRNFAGYPDCGTSVEFTGEPTSSPQTINILFTCNDVAGNVKPTSWTIDIKQQERELFYAVDQISGKVKIPNTIGCSNDELVGMFSNIQPSSGSISELPNVPMGAIDIDDFQTLPYKNSYLFLDKWNPIQIGLNIKYLNGQPVHCDVFGKNLVYYQKVDTQSGCYQLPSGQVIDRTSDPLFCCDNSQCYTFGASWACDQTTFQCKDTGSQKIPCNSHIECGALEECIIEGGNFNLKGNRCVPDASSPKTGYCEYQQLRQVECCPSFCSASGQYCDYDTGCKNVIQTCPPGACCLPGGSYTTRSCSDLGQSTYTCCPTSTGSFIGECKDKCVNTCGDGVCQGTETEQNCAEDCTKPLDLLMLVIPIFVLLGAAIGYLRNGALGAIIFGVIGLIVGLILFWIFTLPAFAQLLIALGVVGVGIGIAYIIIGAIPLIIFLILGLGGKT